MSLPAVISKTSLRSLGCDDTHHVRVIAHDINNATPYRLRCRSRSYVFERDGRLGRHVLDVPVSVWNAGANVKGRGNNSIPEDFRLQTTTAFSFQVISREDSTCRDEAPAPEPGQQQSDSESKLIEIRRLLSGMGAPQEVCDAFAIIDAGGTVTELAGYVDAAIKKHEQQEPEPETRAARQARLMREAKERKAAERKAAEGR